MGMCDCNQGRMPCTCRVSILLNATTGYAASSSAKPLTAPYEKAGAPQDDRDDFERRYSDWTGRDLQNIRDRRQGDSYKEPKLSSAWHWFKEGRGDA